MKNKFKKILLSVILLTTVNSVNILANNYGTINIKTEPKWSVISEEVSGERIGVLEGETLNYVDKNGEVITNVGPLRFFSNNQESDDLISIGKFNDSYGSVLFKDGTSWFYNITGTKPKELNNQLYFNEPNFNAAKIFSEGYIGGKTDVEGDYKFYNIQGELLEFTDERFDILFKTARNNNENPEYTLIEVDDTFSNGLIWFKAIDSEENIVYGYLNKSGKVAIKPIFEDAGRFGRHLAAVKIDGKVSYIDKYGNIVVETEYVNFNKDNNGKVFYNDLDTVTRDNSNLWSAIDNKGRSTTGFISREPIVYNGEFAVVNVDGKYGYVNKQGNLIIKPIYDKAYGFAKGVSYTALVCKDDVWFLIDTDGDRVNQEVWEFEDAFTYDDLPEVVMYKYDGLWGLGRIEFKY